MDIEDIIHPKNFFSDNDFRATIFQHFKNYRDSLARSKGSGCVDLSERSLEATICELEIAATLGFAPDFEIMIQCIAAWL